MLDFLYQYSPYILAVVAIFVCSIRIVRQTHLGVVETFGKFSYIAKPGLNLIVPIPFIQKMFYIDVTERMVDTKKQTVITKDNLNVSVDVVLFFQVIDPKKCLYNVFDYESQLESIVKTSVRAVIGSMLFIETNQKRDKLNENIEKIMIKEIGDYGIKITRVEIQEIEAPQDVQCAMNEVFKAKKIKDAAKDKADAVKIEAIGKADAIKTINDSIENSLTENALMYRQIEAGVSAMKDNSKYVVLNDGVKDLLNIFNVKKG